jgi:hypothetical protein
MNPSSRSASAPLVLPVGMARTLAWSHDGPLRLRVLQGRLWLTRSGDLADHFIGAGDDLLLSSASDVVFELVDLRDQPEPQAVSTGQSAATTGAPSAAVLSAGSGGAALTTWLRPASLPR